MKAAQVLVALSLVCLGCSTPPEVKQALIAKDQGYAENQRLMEQYRELVSECHPAASPVVSLYSNQAETQSRPAMGHHQSYNDQCERG